MKEKRIFMWVMSIALIALLFLPGVVWNFVGEQLAGENSENRNLAEKPKFNFNKIAQFPSAYENYVNDHLPFRNLLITLNSWISKELFATSSSEDVQYGEDGWFFYMNNSDGNTLATWRGDNLLDEAHLKKIAENLISTRDKLRANGTEFILFVAPNKERVYSEYLPDYLKTKAEKDAVEQVIEYLRENTDIRVVFPLEELLAAKEQFPNQELYYKTDTHWNEIGAYIGTRALLQEMGVELPQLTETMIQSAGKVQGDLAKMVNLPDEKYKNQVYHIAEYEKPSLIEYKTENSIIKSTSSMTSASTLLMHRDSFFTAMTSYLLPCFSKAWLPHSSVYSQQLVDQTHPDFFVLETVERLLFDKITLPLYEGKLLPVEAKEQNLPIKTGSPIPFMSVDLCNGEFITNGTIYYVPEADEYEIVGWAVDSLAQNIASKVLFQINDKYYEAKYGNVRADVAETFGVQAYTSSGFTITIPSEYLETANEIYVHVISADGSYRYYPVHIPVSH